MKQFAKYQEAHLWRLSSPPRFPSPSEHTMVCRLRTGHSRLRSHMKKIGIEESALFPCELEAQTTSHVLQSCPLHKEERESTWSTESSTGNKLNGTAIDLRLTVRFIKYDRPYRTLKKKIAVPCYSLVKL